MSLFVDTSMWYAAANANDVDHALAREILGSGEPLVTTDHVIIESWLLLNSRRHPGLADRFWNGLRRGAAHIEPTTPSDLEVAWQIGERYPDQDFSIIDRTSFAAMMRLGVTRAASFDADFSVFRYGPHNRDAFEVLR
jgi:predicted nucleic acid-binding protein